MTMRRAKVSTAPYGRLSDGRLVTAYTLDNGVDMRLTVLDLGGIVTSLEVPDRSGKTANIVLALARLDDYVETQMNFGALVGRYANRIGNASFVLDGQTWQLSQNEGANTLHGGIGGFASHLWSVQFCSEKDKEGSASVLLTHTSENLDQGFPGRLQVSVKYTVTADRTWRIDYAATTDRPTVINLTHHAYFNLAGGGSALDHELTIPASRYLAIDDQLLPTAIENVDGTPFDFRAPACISRSLGQAHEQIDLAGGFDHNWIIDRAEVKGTAVMAQLRDRTSGRVMVVESTEPGLQFYSGNFLDSTLYGTHGCLLHRGDGLCLETQHFPDSPRRPEFPSVSLLPEEEFKSTTIHRFLVF
jgi:aldose 1-epimerase